MPLNDDDFSTLQKMQSLCFQVEDDVRALREFTAFLKASASRRSKLERFYETDWLKLVESNKLDDAQRRRMEAAVPRGRYSILGQDTIWDALSDSHEERLALLKLLARQI